MPYTLHHSNKRRAKGHLPGKCYLEEAPPLIYADDLTTSIKHTTATHPQGGPRCSSVYSHRTSINKRTPQGCGHWSLL